jgi:hypothetical protein
MYEEKEELQKAGKESTCILLLHQWMEASEKIMTHISKTSDEHPLGEVEDIWWQHEYQIATKANLSHIYALICLAETESETAIFDCIHHGMWLATSSGLRKQSILLPRVY